MRRISCGRGCLQQGRGEGGHFLLFRSFLFWAQVLSVSFWQCKATKFRQHNSSLCSVHPGFAVPILAAPPDHPEAGRLWFCKFSSAPPRGIGGGGGEVIPNVDQRRKCVTTDCKNDMTPQPLFTLTKRLVCLNHIDELVLLSHSDTDEVSLCQAPSLESVGSERISES